MYCTGGYVRDTRVYNPVNLATHALPKGQVEKLRDAVLGLERLDDGA
ncbi:MAG TPA: hypothetical protein VFR39_08655 [Burkholderiales bacterium]|nr:hypothetical protein [Burkholderiales bacterium]